MSHIYAIIIPCLSFLLQAYPRFFNRLFGVDVWTRLTETDHIRKNGHKIPGKITHQFIIDGYFDYPPLFPFILSFVSKAKLLQLQGFIAPFIDAIQCFIVYVIALQITGNPIIALLSQGIYMLTPLVALENSYLTPRSFGYLNFTLAFYPLVLYSVSPKIEYLVFSYIFSVLIFLSHRFATQSFLFATLFFTLYERNLLYTGMFLSGLITAIIVTNGYYKRVLTGHLYNIYFWVIYYPYRFAHQIRGIQKTTKQIDFIGIVYYVLAKFSPIGLLGTNVWLLAPLYLQLSRLTSSYSPFAGNLLFEKFSIWILFFFGLAIVVLSIKRLIPIGEGQRYLEMATVPTAILSAFGIYTLINTQYSTIVMIGAFGLLLANLSLILIVQSKAILKDQNRTLTGDLHSMYEFINTLKVQPRIICIPHQITTMTIYNTKADVLVNADNQGLMKLRGIYPLLTRPLTDLRKEYNLTHILLRESFATKAEIGAQKMKQIAKYGDICLLEFQKDKRS